MKSIRNFEPSGGFKEQFTLWNNLPFPVQHQMDQQQPFWPVKILSISMA